MSQAGVKAFAPATVGNLNCGFDLLGLALEEIGDEVIARFTDTPGVHIESIHGDDGKLPMNPEENTSSVAAQKLLEHLEYTERGISLTIIKKVVVADGLGSGAASAVAGVMATNALLGRPLDKKDLLPFAMYGQQVADHAWHADNVAPSLLGGIQFVFSNDPVECLRLPVPPGLFVMVNYPDIKVQTREARLILDRDISFRKHIRQSAYLGGLIQGLYRSDFELIKESLQDIIVEPQRSPKIPNFKELKEIAIEHGALGFGISGSGPSVFTICQEKKTAKEIGHAIQDFWLDVHINSDFHLSQVNQNGSFVF